MSGLNIATLIISTLTVLISAHSVLFSSATRWWNEETSRAYSGLPPRPEPRWLRYARLVLRTRR